MLLVAFLGMLGMQAFAQKTITGTVTSAQDGSALPGVSVIVKGTTIGTITDVDGKYTLSGVPENAKTLVFSFVGYKTVEVPITSNVINVQMKPEAVQVEQVVVTALGISRQKKALGYAVQSVKSGAIEENSTSDVVDALAGRVAGVTVNRASGAAGAGTYIEIRGASSITGNNQPLFVVDGVPIDNSGGYSGVAGVDESNRAIDLNPDDIASITVLKGGAATALYGLRAANGVIIITTKKGKNTHNKIDVEINSRVTVSQVNKLPPLQKKYVEGSYAFSDLLNYYGIPTSPWTEADWNYYHAVSWGPSVDSMSYTTNPNYVPGLNDYGFGGLTTMDDWIKYWDPNGRMVWYNDSLANGKPIQVYNPYEIFRKGVNIKNNFSLSAGNEYSNYYFSASNESDQGVAPNNYFKKTTMMFAANYKIGKKFKTGFNITYANTGGNRLQKGSNLSGLMLGLLRTPANFHNDYGYEFAPGTVMHYADGTVRDVSGEQRDFRGISRGYDNPYWIVNNIYYKDHVNRVLGNVHFDWTPLNWMTVTWRLGADMWTKYVDYFFKPHSAANPTGYKERSFSELQDLNSDFIIRMDKKFGDLELSGMLGNNIYQRKSASAAGYGSDLALGDFQNVRSSSNPKGTEGTYMKRTGAFYGSFGLVFKNMVYLQATGRQEWSTTMPFVNGKPKGFFYPSVSLGFVFSELLPKNNFLTFGKLRASYAKIANDAAAYATYSYLSTASAGDGWTNGVTFPFMGYPGYTHLYGSLGSQDLRPENQTTSEVGVELHFFGDRLSLDASYYINKNTDLLLYVPVAPSTGYNTMYMNAASMHTKGVEIILGLTPVKTKNFAWDMNFDFSNPYTVVDKLAEGIDNVFLGGFVEPQIRAVAGEGYRSIYATGWVTDDKGNVVIDDNKNDGPGLYGFPIMSDQMKSYGTIQPKFILSWNNRLRFGPLTISWLLEWKNGGQMWDGTKGALYFFGTHKDTENRGSTKVWKGVLGHVGADGNIYHYDANGNEVAGPGDRNTNEVVVDENWYWWNGYGSGFTGPSSQFIEPTDWIRLRNLSFGLNVPKNIVSKLHLQGLQFNITGYNVYLNTPYTGVDPETNLSGVSNGLGMDYFNMPGIKSWTFGLKIKF